MKPSISKYERRDFCGYFSERDRQYAETNVFIMTIALILFIAGIALWLFILTPTVRAEGELQYKDVHTEAQACKFLHQHPGSITNVTWCNL